MSMSDMRVSGLPQYICWFCTTYEPGFSLGFGECAWTPNICKMKPVVLFSSKALGGGGGLLGGPLCCIILRPRYFHFDGS